MSQTFIDAPAHGFVANDVILFSNLDGGTGIIEGDPYYVIASGLTANIFQFSETIGGSAFPFDDPITAGNVEAWPTYNEDAGIMAPPDPVSDADQPVLDSDTTTGTVRLKVTLVPPTDAKVRLVEFQYTSEYSIPASAPDAPVFTNSAIMQLQPSTTQFSMFAHPSTWYSARVRHVDVYGNYGAWTVPFFGPAANVETVTGYDSLASISSLLSSALDHTITSTEITDGAVTTPKLFANSVTADKLFSRLVLATTIVAGTDGVGNQHVEIDGAGIRLVDASAVTVVNIPTDSTQPVSVAGNITAGSLISSGSELRSATSIPTGGVVTAQGTQAAPTAAPVLTQGYETYATKPTSTHDPSWGLEYSAAGGAGLATKVWYSGSSDTGTQYYVTEHLVSTGAANRTLTMPASATFLGSAVLGASLYVFATLAGVSKVYRYSIATFALTNTYSPTAPVTAGGPGAIASDGTNLYIVQGNGASNGKYTKYDSSMAVVSGPTTLTGLTSTDPYDCAVGTFDYGATRILTLSNSSPSTVKVFSTAGAEQTSEEFSLNTYQGLSYGDADGTGARFWSWNTSDSGANTITLTRHSLNMWTSGSDTFWVSYSWYDQDGTTHETAVGPRASITLGKRKKLSVTNASIPPHTTVDDPDRVRIYALRSATDTGAGTYFNQMTDTLTQRNIDQYITIGTLDGLGTPFSPGASAELKSSATGWSLKGDGTATLGLLTTGGKPPTVQKFTSGSGTYTPPAGVNSVMVEVAGGGGGGGGTVATGVGEHASSGGGGGGGYVRAFLTAAQLAAGTVSYSVGAGGLAGAASAATAGGGGTTTVSGAGFTTLTALGGTGGVGGTNSSGNSRAAAGSGATGSGPTGALIVIGGDGGSGYVVGGEVVHPSWGAHSHLAGQQGQRTTSGVGITGNAQGGGATGALQLSVSSAAQVGAAGGSGVVIFTEFYVG